MPERRERLVQPIARSIVDQAVGLAAVVTQTSVTTMVNWDLHYGTVLFSPSCQRWVAIDPKPATGVLESRMAQLFWTRIADMTGPADLHWSLDVVIDAAELDAHQTRYWLWIQVVDF